MALLLAFATYRVRGDAADIFFYRHDGKGHGELLGPLPTESGRRRSDYRPSLSGSGRLCAFAVQYRETVPGELRLWDRRQGRLLELPDRNRAGADAMPGISADGRWLAFAGWMRSGGAGGYDLFLYDLERRETRPLREVNTAYDEQFPVLSADGGLLVYTTNRPASGEGTPGPSRVAAYDLRAGKPLPLPGLEAPRGRRDTEPCLSADGRWLAFASDRSTPDDPDGAGDLCLYDVRERRLVALPGLNGPGHDCQPALSADGRYLAFTSERLDGAGQRDIYLYDRQESRLLPLPGLNSPGEEFEPWLAEDQGAPAGVGSGGKGE